jgi:hypothetical protein
MQQKRPTPAKTNFRWVSLTYASLYTLISVLFALGAAGLIVFAALELYRGLIPLWDHDLRTRFTAVLEAVGMLTIAVAALELSQTVWEEEVQRQALMSAPTRVRRFISRFLVVVVVALSIEALTSAFRFAHDAPERLPHAAAIAVGAAALLIAWGIFIHFNLAAEALEPEGMARAKREDRKIDEEKSGSD